MTDRPTSTRPRSQSVDGLEGSPRSPTSAGSAESAPDSELTARAREVLAGLPVEPRARAIAIATDERLCTRWRATMVAFRRGCRPLRVGSEFRNELTPLGRVVHVAEAYADALDRVEAGLSARAAAEDVSERHCLTDEDVDDVVDLLSSGAPVVRVVWR